MTRHWWTSLEERALATLRAAGLSLRAIARQLGRTLGSVSIKLSRMGLTHTWPAWVDGRRPRGQLRRLVSYYAHRGKADWEIALLLSVTSKTVWRTRRNFGIRAGCSQTEACCRARAVREEHARQDREKGYRR